MTNEEIEAKREELYEKGYRRQRAYGVGCEHLAYKQANMLKTLHQYETLVFRLELGLAYPETEVWYRPGDIYKPWPQVPKEERKVWDYDRPGGFGA